MKQKNRGRSRGKCVLGGTSPRGYSCPWWLGPITAVCIRPPNLQHDATSHLRHRMPASPGGVSASPGITSQRLQPSNVWAMKCICCASETETCTDARRPCKEKPGRGFLSSTCCSQNNVEQGDGELTQQILFNEQPFSYL